MGSVAKLFLKGVRFALDFAEVKRVVVHDMVAPCGVVLFLFCIPCGKEQDNGAGVWSSLYGIIN